MWRPTRRRIAAALVATLVLAMPVLASPASAATPAMLYFPAPEGSAWAILAGYNTATHSMADRGDPYAIDLHRTDAPTEGTPVLAPISGTVGYVSSSCITIRDASRTSVLLCHLFAPQSLRNRAVARGQQIGVVAPAGEAGNNGVAHIHLALTAAAGGSMPFVGAYALEGIALPATTAANAYADTRFPSTNRALPGVNAGADLTVRPGTAVTLHPTVTNTGGAGLAYLWTQVSGTAVPLLANGPSTSFTAPTKTGTLQFRVTVSDGSLDAVSDTVAVRVSNTLPVSTPTPAAPSGRFAATPVFAPSGQALAVFGGGTVAQLEGAALAAQASGVWVQDALGAYQLLIVGGAAFIRDAFAARFPAGVTAVTLIR